MKCCSNKYDENKIYAVYKGDDYITSGNLGELSKYFNCTISALKYNLTNAYYNKIKDLPKSSKRRILIEI